MSDYLWDKTGEPEADVEQLENLLGTLKYQPRPLDIPAHAMPTVKPARPATIFFSRPRLAIAASLLLTLLAGLWFVTRQGEPQKNQVMTVNHGSETVGSKPTEQAVVAEDKTGNKDSVNNDEVNHTIAPELRDDKAVVVKAATHEERRRAPRRLIAKRQKLQPRLRGVEDAPAPRELIAVNGGMRWQVEEPMTPEQREATEKLMLALGVASAKFNSAQREMQEMGRAGK
jgi:hypothetical protein